MATRGSGGNPDHFDHIAALLDEFGALGLGELTHRETERWIARTMLFAHMQSSMAPDLQNLRDTCLPLYHALLAYGRAMLPGDHSDFPVFDLREVVSATSDRIIRLYVEDWPSLMKAGGQITEAKKLGAEILRWAAGHHIQEDWFLDSILRNLCAWRIDPTAGAELAWRYPGTLGANEERRIGIQGKRLHGLGTLDCIIPVPVVKPYNPSTQTRTQHRKALDKVLDLYYRVQEAIFVQAGFKRTIAKRARPGNNPWLHFVWFVKFQMKEQSGSQIAGQHRGGNIDVSAVHSAVREVAKTLEVTPRQQVAKLRQKLKKKRPNS